MVSICILIYYEQRHSGLKDFMVQTIDITDLKKRTERESFWEEKLKCFIPLGLNVEEF